MPKSAHALAALIFIILCLLNGSAVAETAVAPTVLPDLLAARVTTIPDRARLIVDLSLPTRFATTFLEGPNRIAIDIKAGSLKFDKPPAAIGPGLVGSYTVSMTGSGRARVVLTLTGPAQVQQAYVLDAFADQPARLVVDLIADTAENFAAKVASDRGAGAAPPLTQTSTVPDGSEIAKAPATPVETPAKTRPLIVLDPGHGGNDSGARAPNGVLEKNIVVAFARKLQDLLVKSGRFDVALTRSDDSYLTLEQRVQLARDNKADLFISLHADTFQQPQIHGTSIYTRDEKATDVLDKVLADNENKTDIVAGFTVPRMTPAVVDVLVELMRRQMRKQSFVAAEAIIHELQASVDLRRFPVRQADFFVLQAPDVPSMLIELGFLSNADDVSNLTKPEWQDRVAEALAWGIGGYFDQTAQQ